MKINIEKKNIKPLNNKGYAVIDSFFSHWGNDNLEEVVTIDLAQLSNKAIEDLKGCLGSQERSMRVARSINTINDWNEAKSNPSDKVIDSLTSFCSVLKEYIRNSDHYLVFEKVNGHNLPRLVTNIKHHPRHDDNPAYVELSMCYYDGYAIEKTSEHFYYQDVSKKRCSEILDKANIVLENKESFKSYIDEVNKYQEIVGKIGSKFVANGLALESSRWVQSTTSMTVEGEGTPVVIDKKLELSKDYDTGRYEEKDVTRKTSIFTCTFWNDAKLRESNKRVMDVSYYRRKTKEEVATDEDTKDSDVTFNAPLSPYIPCFNLIKHCYVFCHVNDLEPYKFDKTLGDKLVLPKDVKDLLAVLINHSNSSFQDIIAGKAGGTIVLCTGEPGTGKTLTAEVYAEVMERPLYCVQSSQLGVDADDLEYELKKVLARATRWKAILLIDEADVYIHERGSDINQNAVVRVFLRLLEYYKGILFLTTNRSTMIDDAIASRATARIRYQYPNATDLKSIWKIISRNSNIDIEEEVINSAIQLFPRLSGRDVKNTIKLAHLMSLDDKSKITIEKIAHVIRFKQTEYSEEEQEENTISENEVKKLSDPDFAKKERQRLRRIARKSREVQI